MRYITVLLVLLVASIFPSIVDAKTLDLGVKTPEYMKATCAKVRGVFVDIEGKMSCVFPRGVVRCNESNHCYGYPKHPRPVAVQPVPQSPPDYQVFPDWQWHGNNRW